MSSRRFPARPQAKWTPFGAEVCCAPSHERSVTAVAALWVTAVGREELAAAATRPDNGGGASAEAPPCRRLGRETYAPPPPPPWNERSVTPIGSSIAPSASILASAGRGAAGLPPLSMVLAVLWRDLQRVRAWIATRRGAVQARVKVECQASPVLLVSGNMTETSESRPAMPFLGVVLAIVRRIVSQAPIAPRLLAC